MKQQARPTTSHLLLILGSTLLAGCLNSSEDTRNGANPADSSNSALTQGSSSLTGLDRSCDLAPYPSVQWTACEAANSGKTLESLREEIAPNFVQRLLRQSQANTLDLLARAQTDPSWLSPLAGNTLVTPLCATGASQCVGDPFRYPEADGPDGKAFFENEATVTPVTFYDRDCARLSGKVWLPKQRPTDTLLPNVVFMNGSVQAPEALYRPFVQAMVRGGYAVLTFDPRGQGRSDQQTPTGKQGSNLGPEVFWENLVDAIDFFRSSASQPYPHNRTCINTYPTAMTPHNPISGRMDNDRLGIAGHSLGAMGVSVVQGYGAPGADPWPGKLDASNPVKAAIAYDSLITEDGSGLMPASCAPVAATSQLLSAVVIAQGKLPKFKPRVPTMGFAADYCGASVPYVIPPDAEFHKVAHRQWQQLGIPSFVLGFQGTTHFDFSPAVTFPKTSWCPDTSRGRCEGGWAIPAISHYSIAWLDRWLKLSTEPGFDDADQRLLDDQGPQGAAKMSFRFKSARHYPSRSGLEQRCEDIRAGCVGVANR
jgi:pimeloyl-ACP methyl ester carboxylesterase